MSSQGIFEIREYIDSNGNIEKHDVRDISKELEYFSKLCADDENSGQTDINDDEQFVRELALLAEGTDLYAEDDADFLDSYIEQDVVPRSSASVGDPPKTNVRDVKEAKSASSASSGWKKGFLGKSPIVRKPIDRAVPVPATAQDSLSLPKGSSKSLSTGELEAPERETATGGSPEGALRPELPRKGALPDAGASEPTKQHAFTGSVLERPVTAPRPITARVPGQSTILLGPKARSQPGGLAK